MRSDLPLLGHLSERFHSDRPRFSQWLRSDEGQVEISRVAGGARAPREDGTRGDLPPRVGFGAAPFGPRLGNALAVDRSSWVFRHHRGWISAGTQRGERHAPGPGDAPDQTECQLFWGPMPHCTTHFPGKSQLPARPVPLSRLRPDPARLARCHHRGGPPDTPLKGCPHRGISHRQRRRQHLPRWHGRGARRHRGPPLPSCPGRG